MPTKGECSCYIKEEDGIEPQLIKCSLCKAAPDMYEALDRIIDEYELAKINDWSDFDHSALEGAIIAAKPALAKAEGK